MIFLATKLIKFPEVTFLGGKLSGHLRHLFSICAGQHLEPEEIPVLGVRCVNAITFSCTSEEVQEHLSDQTSPFVLVQQVFLIKNVISLINCFHCPCSWACCFHGFQHTRFSQRAESKRKMGLSPCSFCTECLFFRSLYSSKNLSFMGTF